MNLLTLVGSGGIVAVFSSLMAYFTARKKDTLQYITGERKEWREKMRELAASLHGASYSETLEILTNLKVRINAYGMHTKLASIFDDSHIWKLIEELESKEWKRKELKKKQKQLIDYISLLLKYDWERSKNEVKGNIYNVVSVILFVTTSIWFAISLFVYNTVAILKPLELFEIAAVFILVFVLCHYIVISQSESYYMCYLDTMCRGNIKKRGFGYGLLFLPYGLVGIFSLRVIYGVYNQVINNNETGICIIFLAITYLSALVFQCLSRSLHLKADYIYMKKIMEINEQL